MSLPTNRMPGDIIQAVDINQIAEAVNQLSESGPSEPGGTTDHAALTNRDAADQHPIGSVTGLQSALNGKAATGHGHTIEDVEYLQIALNNKAEAGHGHPIADVTGLQTALNGKQAAGSYAAASHNHDDRYYTESEVNSALSGKANTSHTHDDRYYTETEADDRFVRTVNGTGPDESGNVAVAGGGGGLADAYPVRSPSLMRLVKSSQYPSEQSPSSITGYKGVEIALPVFFPSPARLLRLATKNETGGINDLFGRWGIRPVGSNGAPGNLTVDFGASLLNAPFGYNAHSVDYLFAPGWWFVVFSPEGSRTESHNLMFQFAHAISDSVRVHPTHSGAWRSSDAPVTGGLPTSRTWVTVANGTSMSDGYPVIFGGFGDV